MAKKAPKNKKEVKPAKSALKNTEVKSKPAKYKKEEAKAADTEKNKNVKAPEPVAKPAKEKKPAKAKKEITPKAPEVVQAPPKPLTRPAGYVFKITKEDVGADGKRRFLAHLPNDVVVSEGFTLQRSADAMFLIDMVMPNGSLQSMPRAMGTVANADALLKELIEMENTRGETPKYAAKKDEKKTMQGAIQKDGQIIIKGTTDIDELIKNLPGGSNAAVKTNPVKNPVHVAHTQTPGMQVKHPIQHFVVPSQHIGGHEAPKKETDHKIALPAYAKSMEENLYSSFAMRMRGEIHFQELERVIAGALKTYSYKIVKEMPGAYVLITKDDISARIPADENKFITIV